MTTNRAEINKHLDYQSHIFDLEIGYGKHIVIAMIYVSIQTMI